MSERERIARLLHEIDVEEMGDKIAHEWGDLHDSDRYGYRVNADRILHALRESGATGEEQEKLKMGWIGFEDPDTPHHTDRHPAFYDVEKLVGWLYHNADANDWPGTYPLTQAIINAVTAHRPTPDTDEDDEGLPPCAHQNADPHTNPCPDCGATIYWPGATDEDGGNAGLGLNLLLAELESEAEDKRNHGHVRELMSEAAHRLRASTPGELPEHPRGYICENCGAIVNLRYIPCPCCGESLAGRRPHQSMEESNE